MRTATILWALAAMVIAVSGCAVEIDDGSIDDDGSSSDAAGVTEPLYGSFSTSSCTATQGATAVEGHRVGKLIAMTNEFDACIRGRIMNRYLPCYEDGDEDPFASSSRSTQYTNARNIMRSGNTADTGVECVDFGHNGEAGIGHYNQDEENIKLGDAFLNGKVASGGLDVWERSDVGGVIWHEAMHQQGYRHSEDEDPDDEHCGYPLDEYSRGDNSIPYMADRCMRSAGIHGRLMIWNASNTAQQLGAGRHRASFSHFSPVANDSITRMRLPPASTVRYCVDEALGAGANCRTEENATIEYGGNHDVPSGFVNAISFIEVEPMALVFNARDYGGTAQALRYGEHLANAGALNVVGNDSISSIYIPAGVRVRACQHEGGPGGHGTGICSTYESPQPTVGTLEGRISYVEVVRVVSAYGDIDLYGTRDSYDVGTYHGTSGGLGTVGDNNIDSVVVPHGLSAQLCSSISSTGSGTGFCTTLTRSSFALPIGVTNAVSFMNVTPNTTGSASLSVSRIGTVGSVVSMPLGINCPGDCSGTYLLRSEVRLRSNSTAQTIQWTGCDRTVGNDCFVSMTSARHVSFSVPTLDQECYQDCIATCEFVGQQCIQECRADCTF